MKIKKHIPNLCTLGNLFCGTSATIFAVNERFELTALMVLLGVFLDFFDGFLARVLGVSGALGKQLDSLADMVTSGVVPGIVMFNLLLHARTKDLQLRDESHLSHYIPFLGLLVTISACYRLAKFNLNTKQSDFFIGLPTPAMSLFIVFLPLLQTNTEIDFINAMIGNTYFLTGVLFFFCYLMNATVPLFSLKFKNYGVRENLFKYVFIVVSVILLGLMKYSSVSVIIILYILLSLLKNLNQRKKAS